MKLFGGGVSLWVWGKAPDRPCHFGIASSGDFFLLNENTIVRSTEWAIARRKPSLTIPKLQISSYLFWLLHCNTDTDICLVEASQLHLQIWQFCGFLGGSPIRNPNTEIFSNLIQVFKWSRSVSGAPPWNTHFFLVSFFRWLLKLFCLHRIFQTP